MPERVVAFIDSPALFRLAGEMIYFELPTGDTSLHAVMPVEVFLESFGRAAEVVHRWSDQRYGEVIPFPDRPQLVA